MSGENTAVGRAAGLTRATSDASNPWEDAAALVFLGFHIRWPKAIADEQMHRAFAQSWENDFSAWEVRDRTIELSKPKIGYRVSLGDGVAYFKSETAQAYDEARRHAGQVVEKLSKERQQKAIATVEAQHLFPVEKSFEELVSSLSDRLLALSLLSSLKADLSDFAYLVDTKIDGRYHQLSVGPLRAHEIHQRVAARNLKALPPVSLFCGITTRKPFEYQIDDLSDYVTRTLVIGTALIRELMK